MVFLRWFIREFHKLRRRVQKTFQSVQSGRTVKEASHSSESSNMTVIKKKKISSLPLDQPIESIKVHFKKKAFFQFIFLLRGFSRALFPHVPAQSNSWVHQPIWKMCYLFLFLSFLLLLVEPWAAFGRAMAWPLVFRWSNNLFLVGNSLSQITQRRFISFWRWKGG